jgi:hypothetical protein
MENHKGKGSNLNKFPQLTLKEGEKNRIYTALLHHQPEYSSSSQTSKQGRFISVAAGLIGVLLFSVLTVYVLSQAEKEKADQLFAAAEEQVTSIYETMQTNMKNVKTNDLLPPIKGTALSSAQSILTDAESQLTDMSKENQEAVKHELIPKMEEVEEYNKVVPSANRLQGQINEVSEKVKGDPFNPDISKQVSKVKEELSEFTAMVNELENPLIKSYFQGRYTPQISLLENELTVYKGVSEGITELRTIAEKLSMPQGEFDQEVSRLSEKVGELPNNGTKVKMKEQLKNISKDYERNQFAAIEERNRLEEQRKAEEERILAEKKKKEAEEQRLAEEKNKAEEEAQQESEEIFPMEFFEISPRGHKIIYTRRPYDHESFYKFDEIARKYGYRYYYTPNSDVGGILDKNRNSIAFINYGFSTRLEYKALFIDLYAYRTGTSKEEASDLIEKVIESGEPIIKGESNGEGSKLWTKDGVLHYDLW